LLGWKDLNIPDNVVENSWISILFDEDNKV
jgi:hypothetical protein